MWVVTPPPGQLGPSIYYSPPPPVCEPSGLIRYCLQGLEPQPWWPFSRQVN